MGREEDMEWEDTLQGSAHGSDDSEVEDDDLDLASARETKYKM
jgi:hypothetical protein